MNPTNPPLAPYEPSAQPMPPHVLPGLLRFTDDADQHALICPEAVMSAIDGGVRARDRQPLTVVWLRGHRRPLTLCIAILDFSDAIAGAWDCMSHRPTSA